MKEFGGWCNAHGQGHVGFNLSVSLGFCKAGNWAAFKDACEVLAHCRKVIDRRF